MADLPPELDMAHFESVMEGIDVADLDVIDEVGEDESDEERGRDRRERNREKDKRSRTRSIGNSRERSYVPRNRSRSPRRYGRSRSRSRDRLRKRSPLKRKSPEKSRGAVDFLKHIQSEFGEFEGLQEVRSKVESHTILRNRDRTRPDNNRPRPNPYQQKNNQYPNMNNGQMPNNQMMLNPMAMPNMMGGPMMGPVMQPMLVSYPIQMPGPHFNDGICPPGVDPGMAFGMQPQFMPQQQQPMMPVQPAPMMVQMPGPPMANPGEFRNASPPRNPEIDLGNISSRLLSQNKLNLSEFLETQASRGASKTIEARPLRERSEFRFRLTFINLFSAYFYVKYKNFSSVKV